MGVMSVFPSGFANGISLRGVPIQQLYPGEVFWVNNSGVLVKDGRGASDGNRGTYQSPKLTIAGAIADSHCKANRGDVIIVMPGHSETIVTDGGLALSKAGVAVIGLGTGTLRPKVVLGTSAAAAVAASAANVTMQNFVFEANVADVLNAIDVSANDFWLLDCEFQQAGATLNFVDYINCSSTTDNNADGLRVEGCVGMSIDQAMNSFLLIAADLDRLVFNNNFYSSTHVSTLAMITQATGKDLTHCRVLGNLMQALGKSSGDMLIDNDTAVNTGIVAHNRIGHGDTVAAILVDCDGVRQFDNLSTSSDVLSGGLLPVVDTDT